jgi:TonB dependent receptor/Carboxypeptidase regulatory-like domain
MTGGCLVILLLTLGQFGQVNTGELRLTVVDPSGLALQGDIELVSEANQVRERLQTDAQGTLTAKRLPFGTYRVTVTREGFAPFAGVIDIRSALPTPYRVTLNLAAVQSQITVTAGDTLLDPHLAAGLAATDRYLDPPVEDNFSNHGTTSHLAARVEHDLTAGDRFGAIVRRGDADFLVPNERVQQLAGQRQERTSGETAAQFSYQHIFSGRVVADFRGMARDLSAGLRSNAESTPILAQQDRGFRELYLKGTAAGHAGAHEWKAGGDVEAAAIRESFAYRITDAARFDPGTPATFAFDAARPAREQALFVQDQWRHGAWTVNAGLRWDHYRLVVEDHAFSPRLGVAWSWPAANLVARASYDRAFQTPAVENLLLASYPAVDALNDNVLRLPVRPSRGDFCDVGFSKALSSRTRLDVSLFRRTMDNFADDDVLLNMGVGFPIAFESARISGTEIKLDIPRWGTASGFVSYSHLRGTGTLPITGGLFLGDEAANLLRGTDRFRLSQDQPHTVRGRIADQITPSLWVALAAAFDSSLPVEDL